MPADNSDARAEIEAAFARYEAALTANGIGTLDATFPQSAQPIHYGISENPSRLPDRRGVTPSRPSCGRSGVRAA
ncbi:AtzH-like domain-containing protein [Lichenicoccus sp.]|uniref:AtzH-like domain-containing protein n=1 Tax=Lichenicoccus sp. TaxID=2781899 RepID=UPI003D0A0C53